MGEVDPYLDEMFDRLSGTGGAGRRALAEAEDHLRAAVADGIATGLSREQAEHDAVARFGPVAGIARQLRTVQSRPWLTALSSVWLLAGIGLTAAGASYLAAAVLRWFIPQPSLPVCGQVLPDMPATGYDCKPTAATNASIVGWTAAAGVAFLLVAAGLLLIRRRMVRCAAVPPAHPRFAGVAAGIFFVAALYLFLHTDALFITDTGTGALVSGIDVPIVLFYSMAIGVRGIARRRRPAVR